MKYKGIIKKSRTLDLAAVSQMVDAAAPVFMLLSPEDIGVTVVGYAVIRMAINALQAFLRYKTTGPVSAK